MLATGSMMQPSGHFGTSGPHLMSQSMNGLRKYPQYTLRVQSFIALARPSLKTSCIKTPESSATIIAGEKVKFKTKVYGYGP